MGMVPKGPTTFSCKSCTYTCKSKPTIVNHRKKVHGSVGVVTKKTNPKKRQVTYFSCDACQSTFDSKLKVKTHIEEQHGKKEEDTPPSPARKAQKQENLDTRIEENDTEDLDNRIDIDDQTEGEPSQVEKGEEIQELKKRIENGNRTLLLLEEKVELQVNDMKFLREENITTTNNLNKINAQSKARILELTCIIKQKDEAIEEESKATGHKVKQLEETLRQQITVIEQQNKEIKYLKVPKQTTLPGQVKISIKCKECSFTCGSMNELEEHKRTVCSEALIQRLIEEDSEHTEEDNTEEEVETSEQGEDWVQQGRHKKKFECPICGLGRKTKLQIEQHMRSHDKAEEDSQFTCDQCAYQTINHDQYKEHKERAHTQKEFNCIQCETKFRTKEAMNKHKKVTHRTNYKPCQNFPLNNCEYDGDCNFYHVLLNQGQHICYKCGKISENKTLMMKHIISTHGEEECKRYMDNKCTYGEKCFFKHTRIIAQNVATNLQIPPPQYTPPVFYNLPNTGQQPLVMEDQDQKMFRMMNQMMNQMMGKMNLNRQ